MGSFEDFLLGFIQGVCEFLPISSSSHLALIGGKTTFYTIIALHLSTVVTILLFYRKETASLLSGTCDILRLTYSKNSKKVWLILMTFVPFAVIGFMCDFFKLVPANKFIPGLSSIFFAILLYLTSKCDRYRTTLHSFFDAFVIGLAQTLSIIPGASRLGVTLSCMFLLGYTTRYSIKFSLLISIPVVIAANIWYLLKIILRLERINLSLINLSQIITASLTSIVFGFITLYFLNKFAESKRLIPAIVVYRVLFGIFILVYLIR